MSAFVTESRQWQVLSGKYWFGLMNCHMSRGNFSGC